MANSSLSHVSLSSHLALAGAHSGEPSQARLVARVGRNTIRQSLRPVASWKLEDPAFGFGGRIIKPTARPAFSQLARLVEENPACPIALFGHTDPVGGDEDNKKLSEDRAKAIYGVLVRDTAIWKEIYNAGDLQEHLARWDYQPGRIDGVWGPLTEEAVLEYMEDLSPETALEPACFLGEGAQAFQGCSNFNPLRIIAPEMEVWDEVTGDYETRNLENGPNRRVVAFLFPPGTRVPAWPCPKATEGIGGCRAQFCADAGDRRRSRDQPRERRPEKTGEEYGEWRAIALAGSLERTGPEKDYTAADDTFCCRFYEMLAADAGCERTRDLTWLTLSLVDTAKFPGFEADYILTFDDDDQTQRYGLSENGWLREWVPVEAAHCIIEWRKRPCATRYDPQDEDYPHSVTLDLDWRLEDFTDVG